MVRSMPRVVKHQQTCTKDSPRATIGEVNSCGFATVLRFHFRFNRPPLCNLFLLALQIVLACCHRCLNEFITAEAMICGTVEEDRWLQHTSHCHLYIYNRKYSGVTHLRLVAGIKALFLCLCDRLVLFHGSLPKGSNFERRVSALPNQSTLLDAAVGPL